MPLSNKNNLAGCDEYPLAATTEGGRAGHYAWVPRGENNSQGGRSNTFFLDNRALDATSYNSAGDAFYVAV